MTAAEFNEKQMKICKECEKLAKNNNFINLKEFDRKIKELEELEKKYIYEALEKEVLEERKNAD